MSNDKILLELVKEFEKRNNIHIIVNKGKIYTIPRPNFDVMLSGSEVKNEVK